MIPIMFKIQYPKYLPLFLRMELRIYPSLKAAGLSSSQKEFLKSAVT